MNARFKSLKKSEQMVILFVSVLLIVIVPTNASTRETSSFSSAQPSPTSYTSASLSTSSGNEIGITCHKNEYADPACQEILSYDNAQDFIFQRFQSPHSIREALTHCHEKRKGRKLTKIRSSGSKQFTSDRKKSFKWFEGKDGRKGFVSATKLGGDWVLAESEQVAVQARTEEVLKAYLTGGLQEKWNSKEVLKCTFTCIDDVKGNRHRHHAIRNVGFGMGSTMDEKYPYYRQDLVLRSQRIITSHTGIMKYSQIITIDRIGDHNYSVSIRLDPKMQRNASNTSTTRPFDSLSVHVGLEQDGDDVNIYASGVMKVNRKVVPNLVVFDASGIAGSMAGKGTLWLAAHFEKRASSRSKEL